MSGLDIEPLDSSSQAKLAPDSAANKSGSTPGSDRRSAFVLVGPQNYRSFRRHLRSLRRSGVGGRKYVTGPARGHGEPAGRGAGGPLIAEPGPVDFSQYGLVARMWMEQVRAEPRCCWAPSTCLVNRSFQCFDVVCWAAGRASGL